MKIVCLTVCLFFIKEINATPIYGGKEVTETSSKNLRFVASLQSLGQHFCGGSILNERWILTAGHCIVLEFSDEWDARARLQVRVGSILRRHLINMHDVDKVKIHPLYTDHENHDIALVRVTEAIEFNDFVTNIRLPIVDNIRQSDVVKLAGWGVVSKYNELPRVMQEISVWVMDRMWCKHKYKLLGSQICTYNHENKGPCRGDSGGPVIDFTGKYVVGIMSYGMNARCGANSYSFHTKVYDYVDWIKTITTKDS